MQASGVVEEELEPVRDAFRLVQGSNCPEGAHLQANGRVLISDNDDARMRPRLASPLVMQSREVSNVHRVENAILGCGKCQLILVRSPEPIGFKGR